MRGGRIVDGTACLKIYSLKNVNLAILKEAEFTIRKLFQLLSEGAVFSLYINFRLD